MADTLESTEGYGPACGDYSPHWCEIDTVVRLRSLVKRSVNEDWSIVGSLGGVMVNGLLENGPGTYVSGRGLGYSVGLGAEKQVAKGTMRIEAIYDVITTDNLFFWRHESYLGCMSFIIRTILWGLARRFLGLPGMLIVGAFLYFYAKSNFLG